MQGLSIMGFQGPQGMIGSQGDQGLVGFQGNTGSQGLAGPQGPQGMIGSQGFQGDIGINGSQGLIGFQGNTGPQGIIGSQGFQGDIGINGSQGLIGFQGPQGIQGLTPVGFFNLQNSRPNQTVANGTLTVDFAVPADNIVPTGVIAVSPGVTFISDGIWELTTIVRYDSTEPSLPVDGSHGITTLFVTSSPVAAMNLTNFVPVTYTIAGTQVITTIVTVSAGDSANVKFSGNTVGLILSIPPFTCRFSGFRIA
jgi:hypothetical protein